MNNLIKMENVDFNSLVTGNNNLNINFKSKMIELLNENFTTSEQRWYAANFYVYMNFHPTNEYPINLENILKMIGFAHKKNAKRTLENNFTQGEDYKITVLPKEQGQFSSETIMLNVDTFKNLCMLARTEKGKEIRKYYVKLENIYNNIITEENKEHQKLLENTTKLLEEKDKFISQLKNHNEPDNYLYIGHNPKIKDLHKIGITSHIQTREESHKSSNPNFEYLFTFKSEVSKDIETMIKLLLKNFKETKPEWFNISYQKMKHVVDFCIMMYVDYQILDSVDNLCEFIARYRSNRLVNTNKARVFIETSVYEKYIEENMTLDENLKVSTGMISEDFYKWYKHKYPDKVEQAHIKLESGNWSTEFQKELAKTITKITGLEYKTRGLSFTDKKCGVHFSNCAGFSGIAIKSMSTKIEYFENAVYEKYIKDFVEITKCPRHKVARKELIDHFLKWSKLNNFISENEIYNKTCVSSVFKSHFIEKFESITLLDFKPTIGKVNSKGCFVGMTHTNFICDGNETMEKEKPSDQDIIKKQVESWVDSENTSIISTIFRKIIEFENKLPEDQLRLIMKPGNYTDITLNKRKHGWHLVFGKTDECFFIKPDAFEYYKRIMS